MHAQCCPVCHGKGIVQPGFYDRPGTTWSRGTDATTPSCRSCDGKGYILVPSYAPPIPHTPPVKPITIDPNKWEMPNQITSRDIGVVTVRYTT